MARLQVELDRLADPNAWPNRCARCGAHGTTLVCVPEKYTKAQPGWKVPLCPQHVNDWGDVRRRNRVGLILILIAMALAFGVTWAVHPRFVQPIDVLTRFMAGFMVAVVTALPLGGLAALWAKTPIRIEAVQGRFAEIIGLGRAFKRSATTNVAPLALPDAPEDIRFEAIPYSPNPTADPEAIGLLFLATILFSAILGCGVAFVGLELQEQIAHWEPNGWRYVGLVIAAAALLGLALSVSAGRIPVAPLGLAVLIVGSGLVATMSVIGKWAGVQSQYQFALVFSGFPLVYLGMAVLYPLVWNRHIRHPSAVAVAAALGPLLYAGVVYVIAGIAPGPQRFALGVGPVMALLLAATLSSVARSPYCRECAGWLTSRRLGAIARTREELEPLVANGSIVSLSAAKTYASKASIHDCELTAFRCERCTEQGTLVLVLHQCRAAGKQQTPTLFPVGRWEYPGAAGPVLDAIFTDRSPDVGNSPANP